MAVARLERGLSQAVKDRPYVHFDEALPENYSVREHGRIALRPDINPYTVVKELPNTNSLKASLIRISLRRRVVFAALLAATFANFE